MNGPEEIKKIKIFNQKTIKSKKKEIATAFYIYDTFKALEEYIAAELYSRRIKASEKDHWENLIDHFQASKY